MLFYATATPRGLSTHWSLSYDHQEITSSHSHSSVVRALARGPGFDSRQLLVFLYFHFILIKVIEPVFHFLIVTGIDKYKEMNRPLQELLDKYTLYFQIVWQLCLKTLSFTCICVVRKSCMFSLAIKLHDVQKQYEKLGRNLGVRHMWTTHVHVCTCMYMVKLFFSDSLLSTLS